MENFNNISADSIEIKDTSSEDQKPTSTEATDDLNKEDQTTDTQAPDDDNGASDDGSSPSPTDTDKDDPENPEPQPEDKELSQEQINTYIGKEFGGKTLEEIKQEYSSLQELSKKDPYAGLDDLTKQIVEYSKSGGNPQEFFKYYSMDVDNMPSKEVLRDKFMRENEGFDPSLLERRFEKHYRDNYLVVEDEMTEEEIAERKDLEEFEATKARKELQSIKEKAVSVAEPDPEAQKAFEAEQEAIKKSVEQYVEDTNSFVDSHKELVIAVDDNKENDLVIPSSAEAKEQVKDWLQNLFVDPQDPQFAEKFGKTFLGTVIQDANDPQKVDYAKAMKIMSFAMNPKAYEEALFKHGQMKQTEKAVTSKVNTSRSTDTTDTGAENMTHKDKMAAGLLAAMDNM